MRKLLIIMTVVFGFCFSILGNATTVKKGGEARKILLKGEVLVSSFKESGEAKIILRHKSKIYACTVGSISRRSYICIGEDKIIME